MNSKQKLSYFLRGLGIGIVFTGIIFSVVNWKNTSNIATMTKEEIIERAKQYGMVDALDNKLDTLESGQVTTAPQVTPTPSVEPTVEPSNESSSEIDGIVEYAKVTIEANDSTMAVAKKLTESGIIEQTDRFNKYLNDNQYAGKFIAGTYTLQKGSTYPAIVKYIAK